MQSVIIHTSPAAADAVTASTSACASPAPPQSVVAPCFKTAHVCQIKWVVSADRERRQAGRVEPSENQPRRCRLLSLCVSRLENCADSARHLIVGIVVRTNQINSSDFLTFVYPYLALRYVGQVAWSDCVCVCVCSLISASLCKNYPSMQYK